MVILLPPPFTTLTLRVQCPAQKIKTYENEQNQGEADDNYFDEFNPAGIKGFLDRKAAGEK